ncbi:MAG: hemolysin family protein [Methanobrevibacter sp.]|nr:hemolysin family protein [Methanobrevibacter sp.]
MIQDILLEIIIILFLIVLNGILAMGEIAIVSSRKTKLQEMANNGKKHANTVINLIEDPNKFLSTIQIGITLIGILTGVFSGATLSYPLSQYLTFLGDSAHIVAMILIVLVMTYLALVIGELVPKRIGMTNPEEVAVSLARYMKILSKICGPLVTVLSKSTNFVLKILGTDESRESVVTEEEVKMLIQEGIEDGTIEKEEEDIIKRVFRLDDQKVDMLMTPKNDIIWIDIEEDISISKQRIIKSERSSFPVASGDLDNFLGVVQTKDMLSSIFKEEDFNIEDYLKNPLMVPENLPSLDILKLFKENNKYVHMALVVDEYGSIEGLITLNDILEGIVGDIPGIDETDEPTAIQRKDGSWLIDSGYSIGKFKDLFQIDELYDEKEDNYNTLAGFILSYLNRIPNTGETFSWENFDFEIVDKDGHRIDKILVIKNEIGELEEDNEE